jgi:hypothetical protein
VFQNMSVSSVTLWLNVTYCITLLQDLKQYWNLKLSPWIIRRPRKLIFKHDFSRRKFKNICRMLVVQFAFEIFV